jgi:hypothetical protein
MYIYTSPVVIVANAVDYEIAHCNIYFIFIRNLKYPERYTWSVFSPSCVGRILVQLLINIKQVSTSFHLKTSFSGNLMLKLYE